MQYVRFPVSIDKKMKRAGVLDPYAHMYALKSYPKKTLYERQSEGYFKEDGR